MGGSAYNQTYYIPSSPSVSVCQVFWPLPKFVGTHLWLLVLKSNTHTSAHKVFEDNYNSCERREGKELSINLEPTIRNI